MFFRNLLGAALFSTLILGGCASSGFQGITRNPSTGPLRLILIESPNNVDPAALPGIFAPDLPEDSGEARALVGSGVKKAEARAMAEMQNALVNNGMKVLGSEAIERSVSDLKLNEAQKMNYEQANELRSASGADGLLRFRITDYGQTPRAWRKSVIAFEIVSTVGIAAVAYAAPATRAIAGTYLVTEAVEETVEAYTGFWALDKLCRPVRIEAELVDLRSGETVWDDSSTGLANIHLIQLVTHVDAATRNAQLEDATRDSVEKLAGRLRAP